MNFRIAQITSSHQRFDNRIFFKQCRSLAKSNSVTLFVSDGLGDEKKMNISIIDIGKKYKRFMRFLVLPFIFYKFINKEEYDIFHLHDPELILIIPLLKAKGKIVIFDSHEDIPQQMLYKPYLNKYFLKAISFVYSILQFFLLRYVDGIVTSTPFIKQKLKKINLNSIDIKNYPIENDN